MMPPTQLQIWQIIRRSNPCKEHSHSWAMQPPETADCLYGLSSCGLRSVHLFSKMQNHCAHLLVAECTTRLCFYGKLKVPPVLVPVVCLQHKKFTALLCFQCVFCTLSATSACVKCTEWIYLFLSSFCAFLNGCLRSVPSAICVLHPSNLDLFCYPFLAFSLSHIFTNLSLLESCRGRRWLM